MAKTRRNQTKRTNRSRRQRGGGFFDSLSGLFGRKTQKVVPGPAPAANAVPRNWANRLAKGKPSTVRSWTWGKNKYNTRMPAEAWNVMSANVPYKNYTARKRVFSEAANVARKTKNEEARLAANLEKGLIPLPPSANNRAYNNLQRNLERLLASSSPAPSARPRALTPTGANKTVKSLRSMYERPSAFNQAVANSNRARRAKYMASAMKKYPML